MIRINNSIAYVLDVDASKVIEAVRSTGVTITPAMMHYAHYLISNMKNIGTWQLSNSVYGFVGGTADSHKFNWKNPIDTDGAFRLTFPNGMTHSANGIQGNGTNQYANTFINGTTLTPNSIHLSFYSGTNRSTTADQREMGFEISPYVSPGNYCELVIKRLASNQAISVLGNDNNISLFTNTDSRGYYIANRASSTSNNLVKNGTIVASSSVSNTQTYPNTNVFLLATSGNNLPFNYSSLQSRFASIGGGFTPTQVLQQSQIVTNAQAILNRL